MMIFIRLRRVLGVLVVLCLIMAGLMVAILPTDLHSSEANLPLILGIWALVGAGYFLVGWVVVRFAGWLVVDSETRE
jgi:hypothetical protein